MAKHLNTSETLSREQADKKRKAPPRLIRWKAPKKRKFRYEREFSRREILPLAISALLFAASLAVPYGIFRLAAFAITAIVAGLSSLRRAAVAVLYLKWPNEDFLPLLAGLLCFLSGHYATGALLVILGKLCELTQAYVLERCARGVEALGDVLPEKAHRVLEFGTEDLLPEELREGDCFVVYPGEAIPVDGELISGSSTADSSMFGGPEEPFPIEAGDRVLSGTLNVSDTIRLRAVHSFADSGLSRHIQSLKSAGKGKTKLEKLFDRISAWLAPALCLIALLTGLVAPALDGDWEKGLVRAALVLFLASPAALVLSVPIAYQGGLSCASRSGLRMKNKTVLYSLAHIKTLVFGKTGTITDGKYRVTDVVSNKASREELLRIAAAAERDSRHPIALAIKEAAGYKLEDGARVLSSEEIPGRGVSAMIDGRQVYVGNAALLEQHGIWFQIPKRSGAAIHVAVDNVYWGHILLGDKLREGAFDTVEELRSLGVRNLVMLTGDVRSVTAQLARSLSFDMVKTELSSEDKLSAVDYLRGSLGKGECLACVGDGFHDAALFERADLGIALHAMGDDTQEATADVLLMDDDLQRIPDAVRIANGTEFLVLESALVLGSVKLLLLLFTLVGILPAIPAALIYTLTDCLVSLNALRAFSTI